MPELRPLYAGLLRLSGSVQPGEWKCSKLLRFEAPGVHLSSKLSCASSVLGAVLDAEGMEINKVSASV